MQFCGVFYGCTINTTYVKISFVLLIFNTAQHPNKRPKPTKATHCVALFIC